MHLLVALEVFLGDRIGDLAELMLDHLQELLDVFAEDADELLAILLALLLLLINYFYVLPNLVI